METLTTRSSLLFLRANRKLQPELLLIFIYWFFFVWVAWTPAKGNYSQEYFTASVLPDSDLEHATEQLRVVGDDPADMYDQLLLKDGLLLPTLSQALAVDDALDHPWRQWIGDHLLLLPELADGHLVMTGISTHGRTRGERSVQWHSSKVSLECRRIVVHNVSISFLCTCIKVSTCLDWHVHTALPPRCNCYKYLCSITVKLFSSLGAT